MGLFDNTLKESESLFKDTLPLDIEFIPPIVKYRENEQQYIASCIKPLFYKRTGKNVLVSGVPGIGKTVAAKHILNELNKETDDVETVYINCWKKDTSYKIALDICEQIGFKFVHDRDTSQLFKEIARILNKKSAVIVLDECDKISDQQIFYTVMEDIYRKCLILITNEKSWASNLDSRVRSRLTLEFVEFRQYNLEEVRGILKQRVEYAFFPGVLDSEAFNLIANKTFETGDIRSGLYLLKEAGEIAESNLSRKINTEHAKKAIGKLKDFQIKSTSNLDLDENLILDLVKDYSGKTTVQLHKLYLEKGGKQAYTTFQRKIRSLERGKFISLREINEGKGRSTIVEYGVKRLSEF